MRNKQNWQFASNTIATVCNLLIHFGLNFFLTSYLISSVGSTAYGFFSMANTVVNYALIVTMALNSMAARFVGIGVHNNDYECANRFYSSVFAGDLVFALIVLLPSTFAIFRLENLINIPVELVSDVKILFLIVFTNMCCNIIFSVFSCVYTIKNRLDISSIIQVISNVVKAALLVFLYATFRPSIVFLGTATLTATIVVAIGNVYYSQKLIPELKIDLKFTKVFAILEIVSSGIWNSINQLSITLLNGLDLLVANLMVSAEAMGYLSVAGTLPGVISTFISALSNMFTPNFLKHYAHEEYDRLYEEVKNSIRFMTVIVCMPISFLIAFGMPFLKLWIPDTDVTTVYILSILILLPQLTGGAIYSMNYLYTIANKVKWQAVVLFAAGVTNIITVYMLLKFTNLGVYAIAGVSSVIAFIRNFVFNAPYMAYCIHKPKYIFWGDMLKACGCLVFCTVVGLMVNYFVCLNTWVKLITVGGFTTLATGTIVAMLVLNKKQRSMLFSILMKRRQ